MLGDAVQRLPGGAMTSCSGRSLMRLPLAAGPGGTGGYAALGLGRPADPDRSHSLCRWPTTAGASSRGVLRPPAWTAALPPGQYVTPDFPVLSAGPTPRVTLEAWQLSITTETGEVHRWTWPQFLSLPAESVVRDIHCVTKWSKLATTWQGVSLDTLLADVETAAEYALAHSYGGYTTNLPLADLLRRPGLDRLPVRRRAARPGARRPGPAAGAAPVPVEVGEVGARHRTCDTRTSRGFWESVGYHDYGDPWREQRYQGD